MKLLRYGALGVEKPGMLDEDGVIRDLSGVVPDIAGDVLSDEGMKPLRDVDPATLPVVDPSTRLGPCVAGTGKFICIGLNYADHAAESGLDVPPEPVIFMKATSSICGPNDPIIIPRGSEKTDWEVELAVIIGKRAKYVFEADALEYVAGYAVTNDVSERAFQIERAGQRTKGKSCDNYGQIGPWLVTRDEVADRERQEDARRQHQYYGLWRGPCGVIPQPIHEPAPRRRDFNGHASRRWYGPKPAAISACWGRCRTRHRRPWSVAPGRN